MRHVIHRVHLEERRPRDVGRRRRRAAEERERRRRRRRRLLPFLLLRVLGLGGAAVAERGGRRALGGERGEQLIHRQGRQ